MSEAGKSKKVSAGEDLWGKILRVAPLLAFLLSALPLPMYFLWRYFTTTQDAGVYMLLALTSLGAGFLFGLCAALILVLYRRRWLRQQRDRMAADGITTDELDWFIPEMSAQERRALFEVEERNPLLGDAYRETLAARITASRVIKRAERELVATQKRLKRSAKLDAVNAANLQEELSADRRKLEEIMQIGLSRRTELEARLQTIEAAASRSATASDVEVALSRLETAKQNTPYGLETALLEQQALREAERDLKLLEKE